jgi:hypothetical protein
MFTAQCGRFERHLNRDTCFWSIFATIERSNGQA